MGNVYVIGVQPGQAGSRVRIETPLGTGVPSPFGVAAIVGAYEWGPVNTPVSHVFGGKDHYRAVRGLPVEGDFAALAIENGFRIAGNALRPITLRLTDGSEEAAYAYVQNRLIHRLISDIDPGGSGSPFPQAFEAIGAFPGKRGGAQTDFGGYIAALPTSGSTLTTGYTGTNWPFGTDELAGATVFLEGGQAEGWVIAGNDDAGEVTILGDFNTGSQSGAGMFRFQRDSVILNTVREAHIKLENDAASSHLFRIIGGLDGAGIALFEGVSNGTDEDEYFLTRVNAQVSELKMPNGLAIDVQNDQFPVAEDPTDQRYKPANLCFLVDSLVGDDVAVIRWWAFQRTTSSAELYPHTVGLPPGTAIPLRIRCTMTSPTDFTVEAHDLSGTHGVVLDPNAGITGSLGSAVNEPTLSFLPTFTLANATGGGAPIAGDIIDLYVNPLPTDLAQRGGMFYPFGLSSEGDIRLGFRIASVPAQDRFRVILPAGDSLTNHVIEPDTFGEDVPTAGPYNPTATEVFSFVDDRGDTVNLTTTLPGAATAAQLASDLNTQATAVYGAGDERIVFSDSLTAPGTLHVAGDPDKAKGLGAGITVLQTGTMNTMLGYSIVADTDLEPVDGTTGVVSYNQPLVGGKDGIGALGTGTEYEDALDLVNSTFNQLRQTQLGLVKLYIPGVTDSDVLLAAAQYCYQEGWRFVPTLADGLTTPQDGADWLLANLANGAWTRNVCDVLWPAWGTAVDNPFGDSDLAIPLVGAAMGLSAAYASRYRGYHRVPAGDEANIKPVIRALPTDEVGRGVWQDDTVLNRVGIKVVQHTGANIIVFGARSPEISSGAIWSHKWDTVLHIAQELRVLSRRYAFREIPGVWPELRSFAKSILRPHFNAGAFKGATLDDAVKIQLDEGNNPEIVQNAGKVICRIEITGIVDTAETIEFVIGTTGIAVASV